MATQSSPPSEREPETIWRLVDAKCEQISDAISATRIPFGLALTWSAIWLSAIYISQYSYISEHRDALLKYSAIAHPPSPPEKKSAGEPKPQTVGELKKESAPEPEKQQVIESEKSSGKTQKEALETEEFKRLCLDGIFGKQKEFTIDGKKYVYLEEFQLESCRKRILVAFELTNKAFFERYLVTLPWGMGRMHVSDFGVTGNIFLVLVLTWLLFALRRENHAIRNFVEFHKAYEPALLRYRDPLILTATEPVLSAEHYAYAYHAVSQRFMFPFSVHGSSLFIVSVVLSFTPALVSILNFAFNVRALMRTSFEPSVYVRFTVEVGLLLLVLTIAVGIVRFTLNTSILLNAWSLAVRYVWLKEWDERKPDDAAGMVLVSISGQLAQRTSDPFAPKPRPSGTTTPPEPATATAPPAPS